MTSGGDFNYQQYKKNFQTYLDNNLEGNIGGGSPKTRAELIQHHLSKGRTIFEIGSGGGIDALELQKAGYKVLASDYIENFVTILREKGIESICFDAKKDELPSDISAIYANAAFVHFSPGEFSAFLEKAKQKLIQEKVLFISVIKGEGYERSSRSRGFERDFYYYTKDLLESILKQQGFTIQYCDDKDQKWIQVIASCK